MKVGELIEHLQQFDENCDVEIWIDDSEGYNNIGYRVDPDLDGQAREKTVEIHVGEHKYTSLPRPARYKAQKEIKLETTEFLEAFERSLRDD